ncbi:hypothetical protein [Streptomyces sp. AC602_WCS936]|uniref:hypothetical protein n=1 Tax=Streptomyces sp. AC602_WCS936 TaxID=2823685 RepID=UPI001C25215A|nr:hypothetical protein [Streptomyces sp. AC602_WCS936]
MPKVTVKPPPRRRAQIVARSLCATIARRPARSQEEATVIRHSSELRTLLLVLTLTEIPVAFLVSGVLPPPARPFHALLEVTLVLTGFGVLATIARHPHTVSPSRVVLRTGLLGDLDLPRERVRSAVRTLRTVQGRGLRRVPGEPSAVVCSLGSTIGVRLRLDPPVPLDLGDGAGSRDVDTVYVSADAADAFTRALSGGAGPRAAR